MFILIFSNHSDDDTQHRLLYGALAICLISTGLLFFVDSTGRSVDGDNYLQCYLLIMSMKRKYA